MENEIERIRQDIRLYFDGHNGLDGDTYQLAKFGIYYYPVSDSCKAIPPGQLLFVQMEERSRLIHER